jgi:hypothetical protein
MTYRELLQKLSTLSQQELDVDVIVLHDRTYHSISSLTSHPEKNMWYVEIPKDVKLLDEYPVLLTID